MSARLSLAIVLASVASAATLVCAPGAFAGDGATDRGDCKGDSTADYRLRVVDDGDGRVRRRRCGVQQRLRRLVLAHAAQRRRLGQGRGPQAKDDDKSFRIVRTMVDLPNPDDIVFRAVNQTTGEVCRGELSY